jgi:peptide/nickel transport system substrate-binding protein
MTTFSRRDALRMIGAGTLAGVAGSAFAQAAARGEAPALKALVGEGKLPALANRLPKNPFVITPIDTVGRYGGTMNLVIVGSGDRIFLERMIGYEYLVRWDPEWTKPIPNLAERVDSNDKATEFTFKLREGLRWSDGEPLTADDMMFYANHVVGNRELQPRAPTILRGAPKFEKIDTYTFKITFKQPNGLFLQRLCMLDGRWCQPIPAHYAKRFHKDFNPDIQKEVEAAKAKSWNELFEAKVGATSQSPSEWRNPERPTLNAWKIVNPYDGTSTRVTFERNPFYWKVDTAGNQLPYMDGVQFAVVQDREVAVLRAISGEVDFQSRRVSDMRARPVLIENQKRGRYGFHEKVQAHMNVAVFYFNLTTKDQAKRAIFRNKDFRIAISHGLDREEMIDAVYVSQGEPWQTSPNRDSALFNEKLAKQYTKFDPKLANTMLDKVGLDKKDGDGFRLGPDGNRFSIMCEIVPGRGFDDLAQLMNRQLKKIGIDFQVRPIERSLWETKQTGGEIEAGFAAGEGGRDAIIDPRWHFPFTSESMFAPAWSSWFVNPAQGEEPPPAAKKQMDLYREIIGTPNVDKQNELMKQILAIAQEEFWCMGITLPSNEKGITSNRMGNTPKLLPGAASYPDPAPMNVSQFFIKA